MKGTPAFPQCGFSQQVVRILHAYGELRFCCRRLELKPRALVTGVEFHGVNVLENNAIRQGIKEFRSVAPATLVEVFSSAQQ